MSALLCHLIVQKNQNSNMNHESGQYILYCKNSTVRIHHDKLSQQMGDMSSFRSFIKAACSLFLNVCFFMNDVNELEQEYCKYLYQMVCSK